MAIVADHQEFSLRPFSLEGHNAVVTGAASGIGKTTAMLFAAAGANVTLADLDSDGVNSVAAEIRSSGGAAAAVACDISSESDVQATFGAALEQFGPVDVLVAAAAYRSKHNTLQMTADDWDIMHAVTTRGTFLCMREAIRAMRASGKGGTIVNVASIAALRPVVFNSMDYDSAKAGVCAMTKAAALEFASDGIRVNAVLPGGTATQGAANIRSASAQNATGPISDPARLPMGRLAESIEQARAILFLASPASSYITGQLLAVEGGALLS